jgi:hypothetical protein
MKILFICLFLISCGYPDYECNFDKENPEQIDCKKVCYKE